MKRMARYTSIFGHKQWRVHFHLSVYKAWPNDIYIVHWHVAQGTEEYGHILHGDITPYNIMCCASGEGMLNDWDLSRQQNIQCAQQKD